MGGNKLISEVCTYFQRPGLCKEIRILESRNFFAWGTRILALESVLLLKKTGTPWHPKTKPLSRNPSISTPAGANCKIMKHIVYALENIYNYSIKKRGPRARYGHIIQTPPPPPKKKTLKDGKRQGTLKRKDISFMNNVISFFFLPLYIFCHPARFFFCPL